MPKTKKNSKEGPPQKIVTTSNDEIIDDEYKIYIYPMEQFYICLADGDRIMSAVMLEKKPSLFIKKAVINYTRDFYKQFKKEIETYGGDVGVFASAKEIVEKYFHLFLIKPIVLPRDSFWIKYTKFDSIEKSILENAKELIKERGYFFIPNLIEKTIKNSKIAREKIVKSVFSLHKKKAFIDIDLDKLDDYLKRSRNNTP